MPTDRACVATARHRFALQRDAWRARLCRAALRGAVFGACAAHCVQAETVRLSDGAHLEGSVLSLDAESMEVRVEGSTRRIPAGSVAAVDFGGDRPASLMATAGRRVAIALDGSRIGCIDAGVAEGKLVGRAGFAEKIELPVKGLAWLITPAPHERPLDVRSMTESLHLGAEDQDTLVIETPGGDPVTLSGIVLRMDAKEIVLDYEGVESPMDLKTVRAVRMAKSTREAAESKPVATVVMRDGSTILVTGLAGKGDALVLTSSALDRVTVPRKSVAAIRFWSESLVSLGAMKPKVQQTPFFDEDFPWQRNRAIGGGPLQLGGRVYEKGIGMHARCRMEFALGGAYRRFTATAGIDDSVRAGSAHLAVSVDGKQPVVKTTLDRAEEPQQLDVDVSGAKKMTILADFVEGTMGSGARVNLCDAVLRK